MRGLPPTALHRNAPQFPSEHTHAPHELPLRCIPSFAHPRAAIDALPPPFPPQRPLLPRTSPRARWPRPRPPTLGAAPSRRRKENEAYASIAETNSACEACGARVRWKIPRKRKRRLLAPEKEAPPRAQGSETKVKKRRSNPPLPVAPGEAAGNCPSAPHDERSLAPHGSE